MIKLLATLCCGILGQVCKLHCVFVYYNAIYHSFQKKQDEDMLLAKQKHSNKQSSSLRRNAFGNPKDSMDFIVNRAHVSQQ